MTTRTARFSSIIDPLAFTTSHLAIIGCGAIGRQLALACSQLPLGSLTLVDPDTVSPENLGPQGYGPSDISHPKPTICARDCSLRNPDLPIHTLPTRLTTFNDLGSLIPTPTFAFLCVDSMSSRSTLSASAPCPLIDTRMSSQTAHILFRSPTNPSPYDSTLFPDAEMHSEPCTGRSTPWCPLAAASIALTLFSRHLLSLPIPTRLILNLNSLEFFPHEPQ